MSTPMEADPEQLAIIRRDFLDAAFLRFLGCELVHVEAGAAEVRLPLRDEILNRRGIAHGGAITTLIDTSMAQAVSSVLPVGARSLTIQLSTSFLAAAQGGSLAGRARVINLSRTLAHAEANVYSDSGEHVAYGNGLFRVWLPRTGA